MPNIPESSHDWYTALPGILKPLIDPQSSDPTLEIIDLQQQILEQFAASIMLVDALQPDMPIVYVSAAFEQLTGYSAAEVIGRNCRFLQGTDRDQEGYAVIAQAIRAGQSCIVELRNYRKDGTMCWNRVRIAPIRNRAGVITHYMGSLHDITKQVEASAALARSEARYRAALEATNDAFYLLESIRDAQGVIVDFRIVQSNENAVREMGLPRDRLIGGLICELFPINLSAGYFEQYKRVVETGTSLEEEYVVPEPHAAPGWYYHQVVRVGDGVAIMNRNITARKRAEEALKASEERLHTIIDHIPVMIGFFDSVGNFEFANRFWVDRLGWTLEDVQAAGDSLTLFYPDPEVRRQGLEYMLSGEQGWRDFATTTKDRGVLQTSWANIRLSDGRSIGIGQDITERHQMEQALRESEERYRLIAENTSDGIVMIDMIGRRIEYATPSYEQLLGYEVGEIAQKPLTDAALLIHPDDRAAICQQMTNAIRNRAETLTTSYRSLHKSGCYFWREDHTKFAYAADGTVSTLYVISRDISARKEAAERAFEVALEQERTHLLTQFIRNTAHEFRTPLSIIGSSTYLMARSKDEGVRQSKADQIGGEVKRMTKLLDGMLTMAALENPETLERTPVELQVLLEGICRHCILDYGTQPLLQCDFSPQLPALLGDAHYLTIMLRALLENAYRYTPLTGNLKLSAGSAGEYVWIEIRDTGMGIAAEELPLIFKTFWRHDEAHSTPGFGLGLAIAKRIVENHGGSITVQSQLGIGSMFRVTLPAGRADTHK
ncbi:MAG: PAS domain S-box protein [Anaerolinea sp.]|nr:PAS domain S-box protein [Anaerolinea sp.]